MVITRRGEVAPGIHEGVVDVASLYGAQAARDAFEERWATFFAAAEDHAHIFQRDGDSIVFRTESFLPPSDDERPVVLLVLGNPASQSARAGMCFAFEGPTAREHRFWRALRDTGWLEFRDDASVADATSRNARRRDSLLAATYDSPFAIGIDVFFSVPSPASTPRWSGVAGLTALFGGRAMRQIVAAERARLRGLVDAYATRCVAVIAFQRDAYENLRDPSAPPYSSSIARAGRLQSPTSALVAVPLVGAPPTRLAHTVAFRDVLRTFRKRLTSQERV